ncbi:CaiB/BaiF CoA transferase family protein [Rhodococcus opacus]|uniref:CaiB/BaiF CoA transferase family protein n=1 Tax=Rhodococcus opacus TaxID=37919 RepID=UPI0029543DCE|nr:CaiB/BaiF CoA-transferase family protein [Rhodococcus opacus]
MNALENLTVVALEQTVAAPFATRQLADLGARVIKIERPGAGDFARDYDATVHGTSSYFAWLNRGKQSAALDVKQPEDLALVKRMIAHADIFVQNLAPGAAARLGLDADTLRADHPDLIVCSISGYGPGGPYSGKKAYDLLVQCETGLLSVTGTAENTVKVGISIADIATGMYAFSGILTALYERERTGLGTALEVAMIDALGEWMSQPYLFTEYSGAPPPRTGTRHFSIAPYGPYRTGGHATVFIGVQNDREWAAFCERVLRNPLLACDERFVTNSQRVAHDKELTQLIESALDQYEPDQVTALLEDIGIANARLRTVGEFAQHPQLEARNRWRIIDSAGGPVRSLLPPVVVEGREAVMGGIPVLGQHTADLREEFAVTEPVPTADR